MEKPSTDVAFAGSVPAVYERLMVPLLFAEPAERIAEAAAALLAPRTAPDVLETAAGTGVVTRALRRRVPAAQITATDLNPDMLTAAAAVLPPDERLVWRQADAQALPFDDDAFDLVVCQFGAMFFPDRPGAFGEVARVLRPDGALLVSIWDGLPTNHVARWIHEALAAACPEQPPGFLARTPHGLPLATLLADLAAAGFAAETTVQDAVPLTTPEDAATALCQGSPLRQELAQHPSLDPTTATELVTAALRVHADASGCLPSPMRWFDVVARPAAT